MGEGGVRLGSRAVSQGLIELGERIRKRRQEIHLSQEAFAEKAGVSVNTVSRVEGGQTAMSIEIFRKMVKALETDANELMGDSILSDGENHISSLVCRIRHLEKREQEIVMQTIDALIDGIDKHR